MPNSNIRIDSGRKKTFTGAFFLSLSLHAIILVGLGGVVVFQYFKRAPVQFRSPPPQTVQRIEPRKLEYKVRMQEQQKKSGRPTVSPRLTANSLGAISLPEVKTQIRPTPNKVLSSLTSFGGNGLGDGLGGGTGSGGLGIGMSAITFFGIADRGERIVFCVDCSKSMLEDQRGGVNGYDAVKKELNKMVQGLSEGTFFNVMCFADGVDVFQPKLVLASQEKKQRLEKWIAPYNTDIKNQQFGTIYNNYTPTNDKLPNRGGTTRLDWVLAACFEQGADTVFVLTDGTPRIFRPYTPQEQAELDKIKKELDDPTSATRKDYDKREKKYQEDLEKETKERAKKGLPPKVVEGRGFGVYKTPQYNNDVILNSIGDMEKEAYEKNKKKLPRVHIVGYETNESEEQFLRAIASQHRGHFRRIKSLVRPITG